MKMISTLLVCLLGMTMLTACGPIYQVNYSYKAPRSESGRMCAAQCLQSKSNCQAMCEMRSQTCLMQAKQDAMYQYEIYRAERVAKSRSVDRTPHSFENTWQCRRSCGCESNFNLCYQTCGGSVTTHRVCTAFCDQKN